MFIVALFAGSKHKSLGRPLLAVTDQERPAENIILELLPCLGQFLKVKCRRPFGLVESNTKEGTHMFAGQSYGYSAPEGCHRDWFCVAQALSLPLEHFLQVLQILKHLSPVPHQ